MVEGGAKAGYVEKEDVVEELFSDEYGSGVTYRELDDSEQEEVDRTLEERRQVSQILNGETERLAETAEGLENSGGSDSLVDRYEQTSRQGGGLSDPLGFE